MPRLTSNIESRLLSAARLLIDQTQARMIVPAQQPRSGYWFGGGNLTIDRQGRLILVGRYRNEGDSRTGLDAGQRGIELAIFRSDDNGNRFEKIASFPKTDFDVGQREVLSIEGSALHWTSTGVELFVSTEKTNIGYPAGLDAYLKPGAGVWSIEHLRAESIERLKYAEPITVVQSENPGHLHVKDPVIYHCSDGTLVLFFCTHPFSWSSSNTAYVVRKSDATRFDPPQFEFFPRGPAWDVAITRATALVDLPPVGVLEGKRVQLLFYDGGESLRNLDEHARAAKRPRGYSCEELGGVAYVIDEDLSNVYRLSNELPAFVSPYGTGCSRYVDVLQTEDSYYATWQQSQPDLSQPLVLHRIDRYEIESALRG